MNAGREIQVKRLVQDADPTAARRPCGVARIGASPQFVHRCDGGDQGVAPLSRREHVRWPPHLNHRFGPRCPIGCVVFAWQDGQLESNLLPCELRQVDRDFIPLLGGVGLSEHFSRVHRDDELATVGVRLGEPFAVPEADRRVKANIEFGLNGQKERQEPDRCWAIAHTRWMLKDALATFAPCRNAFQLRTRRMSDNGARKSLHQINPFNPPPRCNAWISSPDQPPCEIQLLLW